MRILSVGFLATLITLSHQVSGLRLDVRGRKNVNDPRLLRRGGGVLNNSLDVSYYTNITLGGKPFQLLVDTGSSDLWVAGSIPNSKSTGFTSGVNYAVGAVAGPVKIVQVDFLGYTILDQAFLEVTPDLDNKDGTGVLGLGPNSGSNIYQQMRSTSGAAILDRIFLQNRTTPNYLTTLLGRHQDPTDFYSGSITVGEVLKGYEDIFNQPKLSVTDVPARKAGDQHFQLLLDEDGLTGPDGKTIPLFTSVEDTSNKNQATAVVDTGFSLPQIPSLAAAAIYSRFDGAELVNVVSIGPIWVVPCTQEVNITFKFGGKQFPIHPLDTTIDPITIGITNVTNSKGQDVCIGTFQPFSYETSASPSYDMVLGMSFLRNVYVLVDYGDFVVGSTARDEPYIQFLSTTDAAKAHTDFAKIRLGGVDTTNDKRPANSNARNSSFTIYYIVAAVAVVAVLAVICAFFLYRARKNSIRKAVRHIQGGSAPVSYSQPPYSPQLSPSYNPLQSPSLMITVPQQPMYSPDQTSYNPQQASYSHHSFINKQSHPSYTDDQH